MEAPEYDHSPYLRLHRWGSIGMVVVSLIVCGVVGGAGYCVRRHAMTVMPLVLIWFAEDLTTRSADLIGFQLSARKAETVIRVLGWIMLLLSLLLANMNSFLQVQSR